MSKKVSDILPKTEILALDFSDDRKAYERIRIIASEKYYRWLHRLQDKEQPDE